METVDLEQAESEMENTQYIKKHIKNKICYCNRWFFMIYCMGKGPSPRHQWQGIFCVKKTPPLSLFFIRKIKTHSSSK